MPKSKSSRKGNRNARRSPAGKPARKAPAATAASEASGAPPSPAAVALGAIFLVIAIGASTALVAQGIGGIALPGCGAESACARLSSSVWGTVPLIGWPTANLGLAWFVALLGAWLATNGVLASIARNLVRVGVGYSFLLLGVMAVKHELCLYCAIAHGANIAFWMTLEAAGRSGTARAGRALGPGLALFVIATAGVGLVQLRAERDFDAGQERDRTESVEEIVRRGAEPDPGPDAAWEERGAPLTGRWRIGPETAQIRVVIFSDYQCPDCKRIEEQIRAALIDPPGGASISFTARHFPFCTDCNPNVPRNLHPNACWAARAAEAAGQLGGAEAFQLMHEWLFDRGGVFTTQEQLDEGIAAAGLAARRTEFIAAMQGPEGLDAIQADIDEALELGLNFTPMVFVNGVELKGVFAAGALTRTIADVVATSPVAADASRDRPLLAAGKYVEDWVERRRNAAPAAPQRTTGPEESSLRVDFWGDASSAFTARLLEAIDALRVDDARVTFRHYPFDSACNPRIPGGQASSAAGCTASRAVEAAGILGGGGASRAMLETTLTAGDALNLATVLEKARDLGLDPAAFATTMNSAEVAAAIRSDCDFAGRLGAQGFPALTINERLVPRWKLEGRDVLGRIAEIAREEE